MNKAALLMRIAGWMVLMSLAGLLDPASAFSKPKETARDVIEKFYRAYLRPKGIDRKLKFSKSLEGLIKKNAKVCVERAGTDICGFGANGDIYLDAQEYQTESFEKCRASVTELAPGKIQVKMNVYPSVPDAEGYYDRTIVFEMIQEDGKWVVNDIVYKSGSSRAEIQQEIDAFTASPGPPR